MIAAAEWKENENWSHNGHYRLARGLFAAPNFKIFQIILISLSQNRFLVKCGGRLALWRSLHAHWRSCLHSSILLSSHIGQGSYCSLFPDQLGFIGKKLEFEFALAFTMTRKSFPHCAIVCGSPRSHLAIPCQKHTILTGSSDKRPTMAAPSSAPWTSTSAIGTHDECWSSATPRHARVGIYLEEEVGAMRQRQRRRHRKLWWQVHEKTWAW